MAFALPRATLLFLGCATLLAFAPCSHALNPAYLEEWPTVEQVLADHGGQDRQDTLARQMAALLIRGRRRRTRSRIAAAVTVAADEVLDSLEPFIAAAAIRTNRKRVPAAAMTDAFTIGFLLTYCKAALEAISGVKGATVEDGYPVIEQLTASRRFHQLVDLEFAADPRRPVTSDRLDDTNNGSLAAQIVLTAFRGRADEALAALNRASNEEHVEPATPGKALDLPATRLHPRNEHAAKACQLLVVFFTRHLVQLIEKPT
jgi:hypothetical protein